MTGFQRQVNIQPAPAVEGDFASANPRVSALAGPGQLVAGPNGVTVGRFGWADANGIVSNSGAGAPTGFCRRSLQSLITAFLAESSMLIQPGFPLALFTEGDFWARNAGSGAVTVGQKVYADNSNGQITTGATGSPPTGGSVTASQAANVTANTSTVVVNAFTGSINGTTLTISAVGAGKLGVGSVIAGAGVLAGTTVTAQLTGTAGVAGTYSVSVSQVVASTAITTPNNGTMTIATVTTGAFAAGQTLTGGTLAAGTTIVGQISGTPYGAGSYNVTPSQAVAAAAFTASGGFLDVTVVGSGSVQPNDVISGGTVVAGTRVTQQISGAAGGVGHYLTSDGTASASGAVTVLSATETKWLAMTPCAAGELFKISTWPTG